jgi:hypothetical protein
VDNDRESATNLRRVADELRRLTTDPAAKLTTMTPGEPGDAEVIGTVSGFLRLAEAAVRVAADTDAGRLDVEPEKFSRFLYGTPVRCASHFRDVFDDLADVIPDKAVVVDSEEARRTVPTHRGLVRGVRFIPNQTTS